MNDLRIELENLDYIWYDHIIEAFGYNVLLKIDDEDYQGDTRVLFEHEGRLGILIFGWGSCSGCDALQACDNDLESILELAREMHDDIKWGSVAETFRYFRDHDWEGDYSWHAEETREFIEKGKQLVEERLSNNHLPAHQRLTNNHLFAKPN